MFKLKLLNIIVVTCLLSGCSGYSFKVSGNPFASYGIKHIAVPMFYNKTSLPGVQSTFTQELIKVITPFPGVKVSSGNNEKADAVLIGVITSDKYLKGVFKNKGLVHTEGALKETIGNRETFYLPTGAEYNLKLRIILIRRPTQNELKLVTSDIGKFIKGNSKIVFNESFNVKGSFGLVIEPSRTSDEGGVVNFTRNQGAFRKSVLDSSKRFAQNFREVVLNAF